MPRWASKVVAGSPQGRDLAAVLLAVRNCGRCQCFITDRRRRSAVPRVMIFAAWGVQWAAVASNGCGGDMGKDLDVDASGLTSAAADSIAVAADVLADGFDGLVSDRPSGAGIAAFEAASATTRARIFDRIAGQAGDVAAAGDRYDATDGGSADAIAVTM